MKPRALERSLSLALCLPLFACGHAHDDGQAHDDGHAHDAGQAADHEQGAVPEQAAELGQALACGCSLPAVGHCSEWAEVDGEWVELALPAASGLGAMPFCGKSGLRAELEGELAQNKFVVTNFRYVQWFLVAVLTTSSR